MLFRELKWLISPRKHPVLFLCNFFLILLTLITSCSSEIKTIDSSSFLSNSNTLETLSGENFLNISISGYTCSGIKDSTNTAITPGINAACATITLCDTSGTNCQSISGLRIDTVTAGIHIFKKSIDTTHLTAISQPDSGPPLATYFLLSPSSPLDVAWGNVYQAKMKVGTTLTNSINVNIIDDGTTSLGSGQSSHISTTLQNDLTMTTVNVISNPTQNYPFNGILGIGPSEYYCGSNCTSTDKTKNSLYYYTCDSVAHTCTFASPALPKQLNNPIRALSKNNNGVIVKLPSVAPGGAPPVTGYLIFGIDSEKNNASTGKTAFPISATDKIITTSVENTLLPKSRFNLLNPMNTLSITQANLPQTVGTDGITYYSPLNVQTLRGSAIKTSGHLDFQIFIGNSYAIANQYTVYTANPVFSEFTSFTTFDKNSIQAVYGVPFFLGRDFFIGFENQVSNLGTGPYYAF